MAIEPTPPVRDASTGRINRYRVIGALGIFAGAVLVTSLVLSGLSTVWNYLELALGAGLVVTAFFVGLGPRSGTRASETP